MEAAPLAVGEVPIAMAFASEAEADFPITIVPDAVQLLLLNPIAME